MYTFGYGMVYFCTMLCRLWKKKSKKSLKITKLGDFEAFLSTRI
ncbi:hypothetical protein PPE_05400 [Paenibacillus polymyxa E681]|nr:hypothetical protein PPE_05400 [Paenibacillus polymyxa E681]